MSYTKLFSSIITSTIWSEDDKTRIVWISMLALSDKNGEIQGSIPGLARIAGVSIEDCRSSILKFLSPDLDSRTKDDEGRRIEEISGGWHLLNHRKYRDMATDADRAEKAAIRQQRVRDRKKRNEPVTEKSRISHALVTPESHQNPQAYTDTDTDTNTDAFKKDLLSVTGRDGYPEIIEMLWKMFPPMSRNRSSKQELADAWRKITPKPESAIVIESVQKWASSHEWTKENGQFSPGAHLWIKSRKWESEPIGIAISNGQSKKRGFSSGDVGI